MLAFQDLQNFLNEKYHQYANIDFIGSDPIQVPKLFTAKEDIEISAFLTATISWGNRAAIIKSAHWLMQLMDFEPYSFIVNSSEKEIDRIADFYYRTFQPIDCQFFIHSLRNIYKNHGGLHTVFYQPYSQSENIADALKTFYQLFFSIPHQVRTTKHLANIAKGSSAKRINMFLRWMVRPNSERVDFGIWDNIDCSHLQIPLDIHVGNVARKLGMITRKQNDWKTVTELTSFLRRMDSSDPVKYDFALFGLGVFEKF